MPPIARSHWVEQVAHHACPGALGKQYPNLRIHCAECIFRICYFPEKRYTQSPGLLRRLQKDSFPAHCSLPSSSQQPLLASLGRERHDFIGSQFSGFFDGPLEAVEFYDCQQECDPHRLHVDGQGFDK
jgi:hypothetical protein